MLKFTITIEGEDQTQLMYALAQVRQRLAEGGTGLNEGSGRYSAILNCDPETAIAFRTEYELAHPKPKARWVSE